MGILDATDPADLMYCPACQGEYPSSQGCGCGVPLVPVASLCQECGIECDDLSPHGACPECEEELQAEADGYRSYGPTYWDEEYPIDGVGFANPGGTSALRASGPSNPRNLPCPTCGGENRLTPADVAAGYQCDPCADRAERGGW